LNEGYVPTSVNSDLFLPDALRRQLALLDNRRRYARDAYALSVLLASRPEVTLISGRQSVDRDPLLPSRLLFATDRETMARRAREFFRAGDAEERPHVALRRSPVARDRSAFVVRKPPPLAQPVTSLNVTAFRAYLACPYRFYLRHVLGLVPVDDAAEELGPDTFGTLIHEVLRQFGVDRIRTTTDPDRIRRFLHHALNRYVQEHFGQEHLPALEVQILQARARLDAFAQWQAARAAQGWEIQYVETSGGKQAARLTIDAATSITLRGRIDRIDHREGEWAILDYKTGDTPKAPHETHFKSHRWIDLQLPLYTLLAGTLPLEGPVRLGYVVLPKDVSKVDALMADWDERQLAEAEQVAIDVARRIHQQEFWPPAWPPPAILTDYSAICQDHALRRNLEGDPQQERDL
jgi:RecB family exonuclease